MSELLIAWPDGTLGSALKLAAFVIVAYTLVLWLGSVVWTYRDIRARTTDQFSQAIAVLLVALFNVPGLIVYLVIRPHATLSDAYERSLESEAILHELQLTTNSCQSCRRPIEDDFNICPHCRTVLREPCRSCGRSVRTSWIACPYCTADRVPAARSQGVPGARESTSTAPSSAPLRRPLRTPPLRSTPSESVITTPPPSPTRPTS